MSLNRMTTLTLAIFATAKSLAILNFKEMVFFGRVTDLIDMGMHETVMFRAENI